MTPIELATNLGQSADLDQRATGVAIVIRGLTDYDPNDPMRMGWPLNASTAAAAARHIGVDPTPEVIEAALDLAPTLPDYYLNR